MTQVAQISGLLICRTVNQSALRGYRLVGVVSVRSGEKFLKQSDKEVLENEEYEDASRRRSDGG